MEAQSQTRRNIGANSFPSTRYRGSKRKLLTWMRPTFDRLNFRTAVDLMSGTCSVSYLLKQLGKQVFSNDCLKFNQITAQALIENNQYLFGDSEISWLLREHANIDYKDFISRTFRDFYYTPEENEWLDRTICNINGLEAPNIHATRAKRALATHALIQACLMKRPFNLFHRRNLKLRRADVRRTFGNRTTWETPFEELLIRQINEANSHVFYNGATHIAMNEDAMKLKLSNVDLVYIDPPYFGVSSDGRQSNYRFFYHFVEGLAQYDKWPFLLNPSCPLRTLSPNFDSSEILFKCKSHHLEETFTTWLKSILECWPNSQLVLSYKRPGIPNTESIRKILKDSGRKVRLRQTPYKYALNKNCDTKNKNFELLFVAN